MGKAERTKQHIIEQAAPLFNKKGVAGTSVDDILGAAKVAKGCLYGHFSSKEEIAHETVDYLLRKLETKVLLKTGAEKTAKNKLFAFLDLYKDPVNTLLEGGCPILNFAVEADDTDPAIKARIQIMVKKVTDYLTAIINKGIEDNEFKGSINATELALKIFTLIEGSIMISRIMGNNANMLNIISLLQQEIQSCEK